MRILLTGASKGIGRGTALKLAKPGHSLALCGTNPSPELASIAEECRAQGAEIITLNGNLADGETPARLVAETVKAFGGLDAVVSNAGIVAQGKLASLDDAAWERIFAVNTRAPWLLAKAAYPYLLAAKGSFLAIASMSGIEPYPGIGAYSPSKAALIMLVRTLAQEWAAEGIRVNAVSPGLIETAMTAPIYADAEKKAAREALVPMHRIGRPEDIAGIVDFLLSDAASYVTGQNILADGGLLASTQSRLAGRPVSESER